MHYNGKRKAGEKMDRTDKYPFQGIWPISILRDRSVVGKREMRCRRSHGLILKLQGVTEYRTEEGTWLLEAGQILFVRKGSSYSIREVTSGYSCVVNFDCPTVFPQPLAKLSLPRGFDLTPPTDRLYYCWQKEDVYAATAALYGILEKTAEKRESYASSREKQLLEPAVEYLNANLSDPDMKLEGLAASAGVSDAYFRRIFKKRYGLSPAAYVTQQRIRLAKSLLEGGEEGQISVTALQCGYKDPLYFSRLFKKQVGLSPSEYARRHKDERF